MKKGIFMMLVGIQLVWATAGAPAVNTRKLDFAMQRFMIAQQWLETIQVGKMALEEGVDYALLRERLGIAYVRSGQPRKAVPHLERAKEFSPADQDVKEYLYYAYLGSGRELDASCLLPEIYPAKRVILESMVNPSVLNMDISSAQSNQSSKYRAIDIDGNDNVYGVQDLGKSSLYQGVGYKTTLLPGTTMTLGYSLMGINKLKQIRTVSENIDRDYTVNQTDLYVGVSARLMSGLSMTGAYHGINVNFSSPQASQTEASPTAPYLVTEQNSNLSNYVLFGALTGEFEPGNLSVFGVYSNLNGERQIELGLSGVYFPLGNADLYINPTLTWQRRGESTTALVYDQSLGFKLRTDLWAELSFSVGDMTNYSEKNALIVYNITDTIRSRLGGALMYYPNANMELSLRVQMDQRGGSRQQSVSGVLQTVDTDYQNTAFTGGVKWKF